MRLVRLSDVPELFGHISEKIRTNENGWANFRCKGGSVSVWLQD